MNKQAKIGLIVLLVVVGIVISGIVMATSKSAATKQCSDRLDNDGDGYIDLNDPGCANSKDNSELNPNVECDDGIDNDGDGKIDYRDGGCSSPTDNDETNCGDGVCEGGETATSCVVDCGVPNSCNDSDGGVSSLTLGTISGYYNNNPYSYTDVCLDSITLVEYYCYGSIPYNTTIVCLNQTTTNCSNGVCI